MPKPVNAGQRYMPGLDGLRALAVLAVIAYHEQFGWAPGGLLGVGVFFTLSGFLITSLLLEQWAQIGKIKLGDFWLTARTAAAARAVRHAGRGDRLGHARRPGQAGQPARRGRRGRGLLQQLVPDRREPVLLRQVRAARRRSTICGRWPWRSSSTCCGRCC